MAKFIDIDVDGIEALREQLGNRAAKRIRKSVSSDIEQGVDQMAEDSYQKAPVETGALRNSIKASVKREGWAEYIYGSHLPYAQRQEYEHRPKAGYFRKAIWAETPELEAKLLITLKRHLE